MLRGMTARRAFPEQILRACAGLGCLRWPCRDVMACGAGPLDTARVLGILAEGSASATLILAMQLLKQAALTRTGLWPERVQAEVAAEAVE